MRKSIYLVLCIIVGILYTLFVLLNTASSLFINSICTKQYCLDAVEYVRILSISFIVILPILATGPLYRFFKKATLVYFCFLISILIFGDLRTSGFNFNIEYMVELLSISFSSLLFILLVSVHLYMSIKHGFNVYKEEFNTKFNLLTFSAWAIFVISTIFNLVYAGDMSYYCYKGDCSGFYIMSLLELISFYFVASLPLINSKK